jgi:hypothetical protein
LPYTERTAESICIEEGLFYLVCEAIATAATPGLFCQPRVIVKMIVEKRMECRLTGETEVLGENLPQRHFCPSQNPTLPDPGHRGGKPATNRMSYGAAIKEGYNDRSYVIMLMKTLLSSSHLIAS